MKTEKERNYVKEADEVIKLLLNKFNTEHQKLINDILKSAYLYSPLCSQIVGLEIIRVMYTYCLEVEKGIAKDDQVSTVLKMLLIENKQDNDFFTRNNKEGNKNEN